MKVHSLCFRVLWALTNTQCHILTITIPHKMVSTNPQIPYNSLALLPSPRASGSHSPFYWFCNSAFSRIHIIGIIQSSAFSDWLLSISRIHMIHPWLFMADRSSLFVTEQRATVRIRGVSCSTDMSQCVHSPMEGRLGCSHSGCKHPRVCCFVVLFFSDQLDVMSAVCGSCGGAQACEERHE